MPKVILSIGFIEIAFIIFRNPKKLNVKINKYGANLEKVHGNERFRKNASKRFKLFRISINKTGMQL